MLRRIIRAAKPERLGEAVAGDGLKIRIILF